MQKYMKINVGQTVPEQLQFDLAVEHDAVDRLNKGVELCRTHGRQRHPPAARGDPQDRRRSTSTGSRRSSTQIRELGLANYLAQQLE